MMTTLGLGETDEGQQQGGRSRFALSFGQAVQVLGTVVVIAFGWSEFDKRVTLAESIAKSNSDRIAILESKYERIAVLESKTDRIAEDMQEVRSDVKTLLRR